jgi:DNA (cytosine-5)-methyltransferase 1
MSGPTFTDVFCGLGGSSIGLTAAGLQLVLAANHWDRAIETHSANFPDAEHLCADVSNYDWRRAPKTDVGWFSPECTWHSPAGGRKRLRAQLDLFEEYVPDDAGVRSRATALDVIAAAQVHRYKVLIVENVIEFAAWELYDWWINGLTNLGYHVQIVCVSSAHIGSPTNEPAPQWRDRWYAYCTLKGVPIPDVRPRPKAWCPQCDENVRAVQWWKPDRRGRERIRKVGKYGIQYLYRCPNSKCHHAVVEPWVLPAISAIDLSDLGQRIGDRKKPLADATMRRIGVGVQMFAQPSIVAAHGNTWERPGSSYTRAWPANDSPLAARTGTPGDGIATPPFLMDRYDYDGADEPRLRGLDEPMRTVTAAGRSVRTLVTPEPFVTMLRENGRPMGVDEPLATMTTGRNHGLTTPPGAFIQKHHGGVDYPRPEHMVKDVCDPMPTLVAKPNLSLVIPYRRGARPYPANAAPLSAVATHEQHGVVAAAIEVDDCHFRMLKPREHMRAQRIHDEYIVTGNQGEQTMQAGNAVSSNVAQWFGGITMEVLG